MRFLVPAPWSLQARSFRCNTDDGWHGGATPAGPRGGAVARPCAAAAGRGLAGPGQGGRPGEPIVTRRHTVPLVGPLSPPHTHIQPTHPRTHAHHRCRCRHRHNHYATTSTATLTSQSFFLSKNFPLLFPADHPLSSLPFPTLQPQFMVVLADFLRNTAAPAESRQQAGLQLKNCLSSKDDHQHEVLQEQWRNIAVAHRQHIKQSVRSTPQFPPFPPSPSACCRSVYPRGVPCMLLWGDGVSPPALLSKLTLWLVPLLAGFGNARDRGNGKVHHSAGHS